MLKYWEKCMKIKLLSILLTAVIIANVTVFAETINTEDGKKIEFCLEDSLPQNLAVDDEPDSNIKLVFNNIVVNFSVKENNIKCINLKTEDGQVVPSELIFPDDQIEPDKKREVYIDPVETLNENTTYTVEISSDMMAKNGSTLGETVYVSFTTISSVTQDVPEIKNTEQPVKTTEEVPNTSLTSELAEAAINKTEEPQTMDEAVSEESTTEKVSETNVPDDGKQSGEENSSQQIEEESDTAVEKSKNYVFVFSVLILVLVLALFISYIKIKKR